MATIGSLTTLPSAQASNEDYLVVETGSGVNYKTPNMPCKNFYYATSIPSSTTFDEAIGLLIDAFVTEHGFSSCHCNISAPWAGHADGIAVTCDVNKYTESYIYFTGFAISKSVGAKVFLRYYQKSNSTWGFSFSSFIKEGTLS